ncbi:hypothetical protein CYY_007662 [Polysphondylium violaceum]|uniref:Mitochondrial substrate carrier family protein n=1 Tax=Polysphondylium violaceum TaxID=133409 RepID=A0A8J4PPC5_9MYCE|nr:hypothetical protein CYY_007662 [Polysphondylium violaceum]
MQRKEKRYVKSSKSDSNNETISSSTINNVNNKNNNVDNNNNKAKYKNHHLEDDDEVFAASSTSDNHRQNGHLNPNSGAARLIEMAAGCGAGAMASLITTPLDVLKTTMQVQHKNKSIISTYHQIIERGGFRGLYVGLKPTLLGLAPTWSIYFSSYTLFKSSFADLLHISHDNPFLHMGSAVGAGACTSTVTNPIWVIKTRLITQEMKGRQKRYTGITQCFLSIIREEGIKGLYRGLGPSLLGVLHVGVQFPLYEKFKLYLKKEKGNVNEELGVVDIMAASSLSKIIASIVAYPHEVLRSRLQDTPTPDSQNNYKGGLIQNFKQIFKQEGFRGLYKGMGINLVRVTPSCVITFTSYEYIKKHLENSLFADK